MAARVPVALAITEDKSSVKKTSKGILGTFTKTFDAIGKKGKKVAKSFSDGFSKGKSDTAVKEIKKGVDELTESTDRAVLSAKELDDQFGRVSRNVAAFGDVESGARTVGGAVGGIGGSIGGSAAAAEIEMVTAAFAEIPAALEAIPRLAQSFGAVAVRASAMIPVIGTLVPQLGAQIAATTGLSAATATMVVAAIPFVAIGAAVAAVFFLLARSNKKAKEEAEAYREQIEAQADTFSTFTQALQSGDLEGATAELISLEEQLAEERLKRAFAAQQAASATGKKQDELNDSVKEYDDSITTLEAQLSTGEQVLQSYGVALEDLDRRTEEAKEAEQELITERDRAVDAIDQLSAQEEKLIQDRAAKQTQAAEDSAIKEQRAAEDSAELATQQEDRLNQIQKDGDDKIAQSAKDGQKELDGIIEKGEQARIDELASFATASSEIQADFAAADLERIEKHNQAKMQAEKSFEQAEFDAILNNNIIAAMQAQRRFEDEEKAQDEEFTKVQQKERSEAEIRLKVLQTESQQRIDAIVIATDLEIAESERATAEKVANEKQAASAALKAEQKTQAAAEKQRQKQAKRAAEDLALREKREAEAHEARLKEIQDKRLAEQQALTAVNQTLQETAQASINAAGKVAEAMIQSVGNLAQQVAAAVGQSLKSGSSSKIRKRASGGRVTSGQTVEINDSAARRTEFFRPDVSGRIIPLADNIAGSGGGGTTVLDFRNMTVGDIASGQDVIRAVAGGLRQYAQRDIQVMADSLAGAN